MIAQVANAVGGGLGDLMNLVPIPGRLIILPVSQMDPIPIPAGPPYVAMFNPDNWQTQTQHAFYPRELPGSNAVTQSFDHVTTHTLGFDLIVDGTGASGENREVLADIELLHRVVLFNPFEHKPNDLIIIWGTQLFKGVLESLDIKHTLFRPNGIPLRATLSFKFIQQNSVLITVAKLASADLTHRRLVKANDRLDLMSHQIYRDSRYYIELANINGLTTFRTLPVGTEMVFPPLEK